MTRNRLVTFGAAFVFGLALLGLSTSAEAGVYFSGGYGGGYGYSTGYGYSSGYGVAPGYGYGISNYSYGIRRAPVWHDTTHYDYHPTSAYRHGNHYHVVPGHYDLHRSGHWHR